MSESGLPLEALERQGGWRKGARIAVAAALSCLLIWLILAVSAARTVGTSLPDSALQLAPFDARAKAAAANLLIAQPHADPPRIAAAERLAEEAIRRDATVVEAWRALGLIALLRGQAESAHRLLQSADRISPRDVPTQMALIEFDVQNNDIRGALTHYDAALRTSPVIRPMLLPILVQASAEDAIMVPFAERLATNPPWARFYLAQLSANPPAGDKVVRLVRVLRSHRAGPPSPTLAGLVAGLARRGEYRAAWAIYAMAAPSSASPAGLRNGDFEAANPTPPFDWSLAHGNGFGAEATRIDGVPSRVLEMFAAGGGGGFAASQTMLLPAGRHHLSAMAGPVPGYPHARLRWLVACLGEPRAHLLDARPGDSTQIDADLVVPNSGCAAQALNIGIFGEIEGEESRMWVDSVQIRPAAMTRTHDD